MFKKIFFIIVTLVLAIGIFGGIYSLQQIYRSNRLNPTRESVIFEIVKGESVKKISQNLQSSGLIKNGLIFEAYVYFKKVSHKFQAGEYELARGLNLKELVDVLTSGRALSKEQEIKIIEGWSARQIGQHIEYLGISQSEELLELIGQLSTDDYGFENFRKEVEKDYSFFTDKPKKASLEGYLFPDTYRIYKDGTLQDIIRKMLDNFDAKLTLGIRQAINEQGRTIFEIITMASIIELEVPLDADRRMIADIFWRRVDNGLPLQSDATINYITGKNDPTPSAEDLKVDSLYNTYLYPDLPPGPIGNPGINAIEAAIYPTPNDYWYYLSKPDGETVFSKTHEEHVMNKQKWLK